MCEIYLITNSVNGKVYVGKTKHTAERRFNSHIHGAKRGPKYSRCALANAIRKYGSESFSVMTLASEVPEDEIDAMEQIWIVLMNSKVPDGYNMADGGNGPRGCVVSEETKKLHSQNSNKKWATPSYREKISAIQKARMTPEMIEVHSKASKNLWKDPEYRSKVTDAVRAKTWNDPEYRNRMAKIHNSEEYRSKVRAIQSAVHSTPEKKAQRSEIMKEWWAKKKAEDSDFKLNISEEGKARGVEKKRARRRDPEFMANWRIARRRKRYVGQLELELIG